MGTAAPATPAVCGAIGPWSPDLLDRLRRATGSPSDPLVRTPQAVLYGPATLATWGTTTPERGWCWGQAMRAPVPPKRWREVASALGSAGLTVTANAGAVLHGDATGIVPVYVAHHAGSVLFCSELDPLARALPPPLHVNREAWAEIIAGSMVMSDRTPFEEIRRLAPGCAYVTQGDGSIALVRIEMPSGQPPLRVSEQVSDELIARLRGALQCVDGQVLTIPLSGGWDSRFLAAVGADEVRPIQTVTAASEFGFADEAEWASQVAKRLGLPNVGLPPVADWWGSVRFVAHRTGFMTSLHHWLEPLAEYLAGRDTTVVDGLAGDVFIKNLFVRGPALDAASDRDAVGSVRFSLAPELAASELLNRDLASRIDSHVGELVSEQWAQVRGHPSSLNLLVFGLRTVRGIALSPMGLIGAMTPVAVPFVSPDVLGLVLRVPPHEKRDGRWYKQVMARLGRGMDSIPSTNDTVPRRRRDRRPDLSQEVAARTASALESEFVAHALGPRLRGRLSAGRILGPADRVHRRVVRGLVLYSLWAEHYARLLADPVLLDSRASGPGQKPTERVPPRAEHRRITSATLPDADWLAAQMVGPTLHLRPSDEEGRPPSLDVELIEPAEGTERPDVGTIPAPSSHTTILASGPWRTISDLVAVVCGARELTAPGGRVAMTTPVLRDPSSSTPDLAEVCETIVGHLDLIHWEIADARLRLVAAAPELAATRPPHRPVPADLYRTLVGAVEAVAIRETKTVVRQRSELKRLRRTLAETTAELKAASDQHDAVVEERNALRAELAKSRSALERRDRTIARMKQRRIWAAAEATSDARHSLVAALRFPWTLLRIVLGRNIRTRSHSGSGPDEHRTSGPHGRA